MKGKYGFVEIESKEDAEDAIHDLDGKSFNGGRLVLSLFVYFAHLSVSVL